MFCSIFEISPGTPLVSGDYPIIPCIAYRIAVLVEIFTLWLLIIIIVHSAIKKYCFPWSVFFFVNQCCNFLKRSLISLFSLLRVCINVLLLRRWFPHFFISGWCLRLITELEIVVWEVMELVSVLGRVHGDIEGGPLEIESLTDRVTFFCIQLLESLL